MLHQVGDLFELNVKLRCQTVKLGYLVHIYEPTLTCHALKTYHIAELAILLARELRLGY